MARKTPARRDKQPRSDIPADPDRAALFDDDDDREPIDAALAGVLTELGGDDSAKVVVSQIVTESGVKKQLWLFECHPNAFKLSDLQVSYGPGDYRVQVYGPGADKTKRYKVMHANKVISIGVGLGAVKKSAEREPAALEPIAAMLKQMMDQQQQVYAALLMKQGGRGEALAELTKVIEVLRPSLAAPPAAASADPAMQALTLTSKMMEMMKAAREGDVPAGAGSDAVLMSKGLDMMRDFFSAARKQAEPAAGAPAPSAAALPAPAVKDTGEAEDDMLMLKAQIAVLLRAAANESDPDAYATMVYENVPDDILEHMKSAEWFSTLSALDPRCAVHYAWFQRLRDAVVEMAREDVTDQAPGAAAGSQK